MRFRYEGRPDRVWRYLSRPMGEVGLLTLLAWSAKSEYEDDGNLFSLIVWIAFTAVALLAIAHAVLAIFWPKQTEGDNDDP